ncbi:hypothetical protein KIL84_002106 [Mauremys mutica]|uniref:Uncharacterized protein n=1 Tax=Mauremys mutica TaxID=74926 RepID=A0A9D3XK51_9SAUR|nr:hypothetical protein KIL84_002106 [Mauremys mutica]
MPRAGLLLLPLLLCFRPETVRSINPAALSVIVDHVNCYGRVNKQYAFAATLPHITCSNPQNVATYLPMAQLADMRETIGLSDALYNPPSGNIVAARPKAVITPSRKYTGAQRVASALRPKQPCGPAHSQDLRPEQLPDLIHLEHLPKRPFLFQFTFQSI